MQDITNVYYETEYRREWCSSKGKPSPCFLFARKFTRPAALRLLNMVNYLMLEFCLFSLLCNHLSVDVCKQVGHGSILSIHIVHFQAIVSIDLLGCQLKNRKSGLKILVFMLYRSENEWGNKVAVS